MHDGAIDPLSANPKVSRRHLVQGTALTAGALALGSPGDRREVLAQDAATPAASPSAGRVLDFDIPGLAIGVAAYSEIPTGCTVFNFDVDLFPAGVMLELDVRGGAPWHSGAEDIVNAISLAGGSVYGLEVASGVAAELFAQGGYRDLVAVSGAVIYDVSVVEEPDGFRSKGIYPDQALGQEAVRALKPGHFPLGNQGAGSGAYVGQWANWPYARERGGQGGAFRQIGAIKVAVFTVVNALGVIVDRQGQVVRGGLDQRTGVRTTPIQDAEAILEGESVRLQPDAAPLPGGLTRHTTLSVLVTNVAFPRELLRQLGRQVHSSMARAIQPFHTPDDGDILFTVSTGEVAADDVDSTALGVIASELAWDAVLSSYEPNP
ncbi:MAG TPA: P1 family peptidase [Thermomicrobiales bacterium]|nr:P1 family peptidase [Thermomicrobiales bacterium]